MNRSTLLQWASAGLIVISLMLIIRALPLQAAIEPLRAWIQQQGIWAPVIFGCIYILGTVLMIPGSLLTLLAAPLFGLVEGLITISISSTLGATAAFLIARYFVRGKVEQLAQGNRKFAAIDEAISTGGWKIVGLLRLSPAIPFNLQNYLYGLTQIRLGPYMLVSWLAMMPGTFLYVYLGWLAGQAVDQSQSTSAAQVIFWIVGLLATVLVTVYITRLARRQLQLSASLGTGDEAAPPEEPVQQTQSKRVVAWLIVASLMLIAAIWCNLQKDRIAEWFQFDTAPDINESGN